MTNKYIRIVGGQYRRTPITVIDAPGLRPTPDRVRETLYNWLQYFWDGEFAGKRVLDLFAGSGALGFEAASRGVAHVQMVERDKAALAALRTLRDKLGASQIRIHAGDAMETLRRMDASRYDLVLLDPPFGQGWLERVWPLLPGILNDGALVYVESEADIQPDALAKPSGHPSLPAKPPAADDHEAAAARRVAEPSPFAGAAASAERPPGTEPGGPGEPGEPGEPGQQFEILRKDRAGAVHYALLRFAAMRK